MKMSRSFFVYSPGYSEELQGNAHVLFNSYCPQWLVVNDTGLEIAHLFDSGKTVDETAELMAKKYGIPEDIVRRDVIVVCKQLNKHFEESRAGRGTYREPVLDSIYLHVTNRCNLSCLQCYFSCSENHEKEDTPVALIRQMVDELIRSGGRSITISGGEPLLHPDIKEILTYATERDLTIRLLTNGTLINNEWAAILSDMNIYIQVSVDGATGKIHDSVRSPGSYEKALGGIQNLQNAGLSGRINICTTVMNQNVDDLENIISLGERIGVPLVRFLPLRKEGSARKSWSRVGSGIDPVKIERFYRFVSELNVSGTCSAEVSCGLSGFMLSIPDDVSKDGIWCPVGTQLVFDVNGDAYPCVLMMREAFKLGNAHTDSLQDMISSKQMEQISRELVERRFRIEECSLCYWRNLCQAGCMGQALDECDTIWKTDSYCPYRNRIYREAFDKLLKIDKTRRGNGFEVFQG